MTFLIALGLGLVGACPDPKMVMKNPGRYLGIAGVLTVIYTMIMAIILYFGLPSFAGPVWGMTGYLIAMWVLNLIVVVVRSSDSDDGWPIFGVPFLVIFLAVSGVRGCAGTDMWTSKDRFDLVGDVEKMASTEDLDPIDVRHIRLVSLEQAAWLANKALGDKPGEALGSRFHVGFPTLQRIKGDFVYIAPLEYNAFRHWQSSNGTPGYVWVSATDPKAQPKLVTTSGDKALSFRYMPSAFFGDNLERYVYANGFRSSDINDYHFELDDNENPWWVVTLTQPSIHYSVEKIVTVILVDPTSGKIESHTLSDLPTWVDRAIPENLAVTYLTWFGSYEHGWWNSVWEKRGVIEPTVNQNKQHASAERVSLVYGSDGQAYWFTGMTSTASTDQALVSCVMMNSRTGKVKQFNMTGANEAAVMEQANAAVRNFQGQHATSPIPYHLYGETAWVVPIISETHIFQRVAIVRGKDLQVALGDTRQLALDKFKQQLAGGGGQVDPSSASTTKKITLIVDRFYGDVQGGSTVYYLWSTTMPKKIFTGSSQISSSLPLVAQGDTIEIEYMDTTEAVVPISALVWKPRASPN